MTHVRYGFAVLDAPALALVQKWTAGKHVWDVMCGHGDLTAALLRVRGARAPHSVESCDKETTLKPRARWQHTRCLVEDWRPSAAADVALLSFPINWAVPGLPRLLARVERVVYIGANRYPSSCGGPDLWRHLLARPVLDAHQVAERESMVVVFGGPVDRENRDAALTAAPELYAVAEQWGQWLPGAVQGPRR